MIEVLSDSIFHLATDNTSYVIHILETGHAEHIYYGKRLKDVSYSISALREKRYARPGMGTYTDHDFPTLVLDDSLLEFSSEGRGDYKVPLIAVSLGKEGERTLDLRYKGYTKENGIKRFAARKLPQAKDAHLDAETLTLTFTDAVRMIDLQLVYTIFPSLDTITRRSIVLNRSKERITIRSLMSAQLDWREDGMKAIMLSGTWGREMEKIEKNIERGTIIAESRMLSSSAEANPAFMIEKKDGSCYALNLIYSGPHRISLSLTPHGMTHAVWGLNPDMFSWVLDSNESFEAPEAVMTYSEKGRDEAGDRIKSFILTAIMRSSWKDRMRPVMLDTWEAAGYGINEKKIAALADGAAKMGCEGVLLNDGWFGARNNDRTSLGDWHVNTIRFPSGLNDAADTVHRHGLLFGLWFEGEAASTKSVLLHDHPEWVIGRNAETNAEGRHEQLLDITRYDVQDWIISTISKISDLVRLDFLRWDLNRCYSDLYTLSGIRDYGMYAHEYICALYKILSAIGERFPDMYIETTAGGGSRFDLGMLSVSSSMVPSCISDPIERARITGNAALMYPLSAISTVVSPSPNGATRRIVDRDTRFNIAAFGVLSYSMDTTAMSRSEMASFRAQIEFYKANRMLLETGRFRIVEDGNRTIWTIANEDRSEILLLYLQHFVKPNTTAERIIVPDANESYNYRIYARSHTVSEKEAYTYPQENECYFISGDALKWAGVSLVEQVSGIGYHEGMRFLGDFSSRLYIIKRVDNE